MWLTSRRSVTFSVAVNSFSGTFQRLQLRVHVLVERERALLDESERAHRRDRLADRASLKERRIGDGSAAATGHAVGARLDPAVLDDRERQPVDLALGHLRLDEGIEIVGWLRGPQRQDRHGGERDDLERSD